MELALDEYKTAKKACVDAGLDKATLKLDMQSTLGDFKKTVEKFESADKEFSEAQSKFLSTCTAYTRFIETDKSIKTLSNDSAFEKGVRGFSSEIALLLKQSKSVSTALKMDTTDYVQFKKECERKGVDTKSLKGDFKKQVNDIVALAKKMTPLAKSVESESLACKKLVTEYLKRISAWTATANNAASKTRGDAFGNVLKTILKQVTLAGESAKG